MGVVQCDSAADQTTSSSPLTQVNEKIALVIENLRLARADLEIAPTSDESAAIKLHIEDLNEQCALLSASRLCLLPPNEPGLGKNETLAFEAVPAPTSVLYAKAHHLPQHRVPSRDFSRLLCDRFMYMSSRHVA
jgi:hypothetical protein